MAEDRRTAGFLEMIAEMDQRHLVGVDGVSEVWLIRHADAYSGITELAAGRIDTPLSERGLEQAMRLAVRLAAVPLQAVWSSELLRARQTAEMIAAGHSLEVRVDARLREVRTHWDDGREPERSKPGSYPFPEAEAEVAERMKSVVTEVAAGLAHVGSARPRAALVTHNAAIAVYLSSLLGLNWGQLRVLPQFTSVSVVAVRGEQMVVQSIADVTHLVTAPD